MSDEKLRDRILARCVRNPETNCMEWVGAGRGVGYGAIKVAGKTVDTHVAMWRAVNGDVPKGMLVCHRCDNRRCCNPAHLWLGTYTDNARDMHEKGRAAVLRPLSPEQEALAMDARGVDTATNVGRRLGVSGHSVLMLWRSAPRRARETG